MRRTQFYKVETHNTDIQELDYLNGSLSDFKMRYAPNYYRVDSSDLMRPDMISYKLYGTVNYWWLILLANNIQDPFNDITVGQQLTIPNILDVYDFFKKSRKR